MTSTLLPTGANILFFVEHWALHLLTRTWLMTTVLHSTLPLSTQTVSLQSDHDARAMNVAAIGWLLRLTTFIMSASLMPAPGVWRQLSPMPLALFVIEEITAVHIDNIITA